MMKSIRTLVRQDREKYVIPRRVQDVIPIQKIWEDGIFLTGGRYAKTFRFTDINYQWPRSRTRRRCSGATLPLSTVWIAELPQKSPSSTIR